MWGACTGKEHGCLQRPLGLQSPALGCHPHVSTAKLPFPFLGLLLEHGRVHLHPSQTKGEECWKLGHDPPCALRN